MLATRYPGACRLGVKTSQGAPLLARQVYLSKRPCPVRGRGGGLGPDSDIRLVLLSQKAAFEGV